MDIPNKEVGVFLLERGKASIFTQLNLTGISLQVPNDIINDMEIVSEDKLMIFIKRLLELNKTVIRGVVIVLSSDFTFENVFEEDNSEKLMEKLKAFQEIVPFENVDSKITKQESKWKVICTSRDLCEKLRLVFEKLNIFVLGVTSFAVISETISQMPHGFDPRLVMDKIDAIKLSGFISQEQENKVAEQAKKSGEKNKNLPVLAVVFGSLLLILLFLIYFNYLRK